MILPLAMGSLTIFFILVGVLRGAPYPREIAGWSGFFLALLAVLLGVGAWLSAWMALTIGSGSPPLLDLLVATGIVVVASFVWAQVFTALLLKLIGGATARGPGVTDLEDPGTAQNASVAESPAATRSPSGATVPDDR